MSTNRVLESLMVGVWRGAADYREAETAVRAALAFAGFDGANPLASLIQPGETVLLKPNLIREGHALRADEWEQVITHPAVLRAILKLAVTALDGRGRVIIADGPQTDSDFDELCRRVQLRELVQEFQSSSLAVELIDLRRDRWYQRGDVIYKRETLPGDPAGYTTVDLADASEFGAYALNGQLYGADYDMAETASFHSGGHHRYILCRSVMDADVVINLPKCKTHKKTGVTLSLKNLVGINGYRNCLPHHTLGTPSEAGDEFDRDTVSHRAQSRAIAGFKRALTAVGGEGGAWARAVKRAGRSVFGDTNEVVRSGNWHGNDTAWRMVLDLNKAFFYFDGSGGLRQTPRRYLALVDGIIAGEGNGPSAPDAVPAGLLIAGINPVAVDTVCANLMGFDDARLPLLAHSWKIQQLPLVMFTRNEIQIASNQAEWVGTMEQMEHAPHLAFRPHFGWRGTVERPMTP